MNIYRKPTEDELKDFIPLVKTSRNKTASEKFREDLNKAEQEATKKGLPFARQVAEDDWKDHYSEQTKTLMRQDGYVDVQKIEPFKVDFNKYSDLKNFEVIEEGETFDADLSKKNPGITVNVKKTVYRYKGYSNKYRVMESGPDAVKRATQRKEEINKNN